MYYLGVDIGGTTIKAGLVDETGQIVDRARIPTIIDSQSGFLSSLTELIRGFQNAPNPPKIQAIGIGIPGLRNATTRRIIFSPNIPCLTNLSLEKPVADEVHLPVTTENDANAAAYAEFVCGLGKGLLHFAYLTLGTGLGSGVILNGKLFTGTSGYAMEFGHTVMEPEGRPCGCGNSGCLETLVSAQGIVLTALELMRDEPQSSLRAIEEPLTAELISEQALAGDAVSKATFDRTGRWLGIACGNLINMLNLQMIALGGGIMAAGELLLKPAIAEAQRHSIAPMFQDSRIVQSTSGPDAGIIGAAMLARDRH